MMTSIRTKNRKTRIRQTRDAAGWLALAAAPAFALMACISALDTSASAICSAGTGVLPIGGMVWMYLLMSLFHLSPWLKLASRLAQPLTYSATPSKGD